MNAWTFVPNHAVILNYIGRHALITARVLPLEIGIIERAVRRIIAELEDGGYIAMEKEKGGFECHNPRLPLGHRTQRDKMVGGLLRVLGLRLKQSMEKGK